VICVLRDRALENIHRTGKRPLDSRLEKSYNKVVTTCQQADAREGHREGPSSAEKNRGNADSEITRLHVLCLALDHRVTVFFCSNRYLPLYSSGDFGNTCVDFGKHMLALCFNFMRGEGGNNHLGNGRHSSTKQLTIQMTS